MLLPPIDFTKMVASKITMLMQPVFCCHLLVFKKLAFDPQSAPDCFLGVLNLQTGVLVFSPELQATFQGSSQ